MLSFEEFYTDVIKGRLNSPKDWRFGQAVFNYIEKTYGVARDVQFIDNIDCFYHDEDVERFIIASYRRYFEKLNN